MEPTQGILNSTFLKEGNCESTTGLTLLHHQAQMAFKALFYTAIPKETGSVNRIKLLSSQNSLGHNRPLKKVQGITEEMPSSHIMQGCHLIPELVTWYQFTPNFEAETTWRNYFSQPTSHNPKIFFKLSI